MLGLVGVTSMDVSVAAVTVNVVDPETLPRVAVMVLLPTATDVARPMELVALLMVALVILEELQVTDAVISCVVLSE